MAVKGTTSGQMAGIDPKIFGLLGIQDNKDIDLGTYKTLLKEKMVAGRMTDSKMSTEDTEALTNAWKDIKNDVQNLQKDNNISGKSVAENVTDRKPPSASKISPQKLLPGAGGSLQKVDQKDDKGVEANKAEISKIKSFLEGPLGSGLGKIEENLQGVLSALTASNRADKRDTRKSHVDQTKAAKRGREDQLESKAADLGKGILEKAIKPVKGFFGMFFDFIKNVLLGGMLLRLISIIENPMRLLDPLFNVINGIIDFLNWIISSIVNLLTMPFNWVIKGINVGVGFLISGVNKALSLIPGVGESVVPDLKIPEIPQMEGIIPKIPMADEKSPPVQGAEGGGTIINVQGAEEGGVVNNVNIQGAEGGSVVQSAFGGAAVAGGSAAALAGGARIAAQAGRMAAGVAKVGSGAAKVGSTGAKVGKTAGGIGGKMGKIGGKVGKFGKQKLKEKAIDAVTGGGKKKESSGSGSGTVSGGGGGSPSFGSVSSGAPTLAVAGGGNVTKVDAKKISAKEGGPVTGGSGITVTGMGKDTQLLAAQPGEVVMSKKAVDKIGADRLLAANKAGGGDNKPRFSNVNNIQATFGGGTVQATFSGGEILQNVMGMQGGGLVAREKTSAVEKSKRTSHRIIPDTASTSWAAGIPLTRVRSKSGSSAEVATALADRFQGFITDLEATGYKIKEMGGFRPDGPPPGNVDGKGPMYAHPYGAAIDINWTDNPAFVKHPHDFPAESGALAANHGLGWGNFFDDAMHFSAMKRERGTGIGGMEISGDSLRGATGDVAATSKTASGGGGAAVISKGTNSPQSSPPGPPGSSGGTNVSVIPGGGQQGGGQGSGTAGDQKTPPTFSPRDGNNPMLVVVKSIYNVLGS